MRYTHEELRRMKDFKLNAVIAEAIRDAPRERDKEFFASDDGFFHVKLPAILVNVLLQRHGLEEAVQSTAQTV